MEKYGLIIENILNKYIKSSEFGVHSESDSCVEVEDIGSYIFNCRKAEDELVEGLWVATGATKMVIGSNELDYVLKVPFQGSWWNEYSEDDNGNEFSECCFSDFYYNDYCYIETEVYERAKEYGVEAIFAKVEFVKDLDCGIPVYRQPRAESSYKTGGSTTPSKAAINYAEEHRYDTPFKVHWSAQVIEVYGQDFFDRLIQFLDNDDFAGSDLHDGNYGYTPEGLPIIMDYAGYFE